jgi:2-polyprenyl-6-methoxyphenol hydroxylase-like FAD-dependent oxidoreductase
MDADLAVIGGGPVGSTLALLLARAGRRVTVLERARLPRDKACGEGLLPSGARVLASAGIALEAEGFPPVLGVRYRLEGGSSVRGDLRSGSGRGVRRTRFDALLAERACSTPGVRFLCGCAAQALHPDAGGVRVETPDGPLRAYAVVAADGLRSATARWLGWARPPAGRPRHALVGHLAADAGALGDEIVVTLLDDVEVYAAPVGPCEVLAAVLGPRGALRHAASSVTDSYLAAVRRAHPALAGAPPTRRVRGAGPFRTRPRTVAADRVFLAGDAAGFLDPLTGDGIAAGLAQAAALAGLLAAPLDLADGRQVAAVAARYRSWHARQWRRRRLVTALALALTGSTSLARRGMAGVERRPQALQSLLEVNDGTRGLGAVSPRDWAALAGF